MKWQELERLLSLRGEGHVGYVYASGETGPNNLTLPSDLTSIRVYRVQDLGGSS